MAFCNMLEEADLFCRVWVLCAFFNYRDSTSHQTKTIHHLSHKNDLLYHKDDLLCHKDDLLCHKDPLIIDDDMAAKVNNPPHKDHR